MTTAREIFKSCSPRIVFKISASPLVIQRLFVEFGFDISIKTAGIFRLILRNEKLKDIYAKLFDEGLVPVKRGGGDPRASQETKPEAIEP